MCLPRFRASLSALLVAVTTAAPAAAASFSVLARCLLLIPRAFRRRFLSRFSLHRLPRRALSLLMASLGAHGFLAALPRILLVLATPALIPFALLLVLRRAGTR